MRTLAKLCSIVLDTLSPFQFYLFLKRSEEKVLKSLSKVPLWRAPPSLDNDPSIQLNLHCENNVT